MNDTELINEILHKLKSDNAGHFDRLNLLDSLDKIDFGINSTSKKVEELKEEIKEMRDSIKSVFWDLEDI